MVASSLNGRGVLVFDMDGVLVDVTESYRETVVRTVEHFTSRKIERDTIQDYKNAGGWNNDWALSQKICADLGVTVEYSAVVEHFNRLFLDEGLIHRERWLPRKGLLDSLGGRYHLAIFTGRSTLEANLTLEREGFKECFWLLSSDTVPREKPAPDGLLMVQEKHPGKKMFYVGDTVDDARSARAAGVPFIGIAAPHSPRREELIQLLQSENAIAVLDDVNQLESVL